MSLLLRRTISTPKCLFSFQQASPFSTLKTPQPRKARTPKIPPSLTSSRMVKKQGTSAPTWPRPAEITFQDKVANSVNLFGKVEMPIQFHATPEGKHVASTFISQKNVALNGKSSDSLSIPVVFEGDLAHTVACHVKKDDCVYVTGKLSWGELPFVLSEYRGKFYVIGNELNFVQGLERKEDKLVEMDVGNDVGVKKQVGSRKCRVDEKRLDSDRELEELNLGNKIEEMEIGVLSTEKMSDKIEEKEVEVLNTEKKRSSSVRGTKKDGEPGLDLWKNFDVLNTEKKSNEIKEKEIELLSTGKKRSSNVGGATKDVLDSWKDFLKNPMDWSDNREKKSSGLLKANFPDFKHKTNGTSLWLSSAPKGVLPELGRVGLDVNAQVQAPKGRPTKDSMVKNEDTWKSLVQNPDKWWDCRSKKTSIKSPDFKHKDTGEALWLNSSPDWVLSLLLPSEKDKNVSAGNKKALEGLDVDSQAQVPKGQQVKGGKVKNEDSWKSLVENPNKWWDCRSNKTSIKSPDFKHKDTGEALWLNNSPEWVLSQFPPSKNEQNVSAGNKKALEGLDVDAQVQVPKLRPAKGGKVKNEDSWKSLVANPDKWWDNRSGKTNMKAPDFKHKETGEALWLNNSPEWVSSQLPPTKNGQSVTAGYKKAFVA